VKVKVKVAVEVAADNGGTGAVVGSSLPTDSAASVTE
jgi:hypothetical protein